MNPLFKIFGIGNVFSAFDKKVEATGWSNGCKWLIKELGIRYESIKISKKGPSIIYSNHPTGLDPYLLTAVIGRDDSYFWGDIYQSKKGKNISKHIIPVAPRPFWTIVRRPITNWPGYIYMRLTTPALSKEKTKDINKKALEKTIELLKNKKQIIIFPSGGEYEFLPKKKGLSIILDECKKRNIKVTVYGIKIKKFGEVLLLAHFIFKTKIEAKISSGFTI